MDKLEHFEMSQRALERSAWIERKSLLMAEASQRVIENSYALLMSLRADRQGSPE